MSFTPHISSLFSLTIGIFPTLFFEVLRSRLMQSDARREALSAKLQEVHIANVTEIAEMEAENEARCAQLREERDDLEAQCQRLEEEVIKQSVRIQEKDAQRKLLLVKIRDMSETQGEKDGLDVASMLEVKNEIFREHSDSKASCLTELCLSKCYASKGSIGNC